MTGHMQHIRDRYGVPAYRGGRIRFMDRLDGTIVAARNDYLRVRIDGARGIAILHPKWEVEYLPSQVTITTDPLLTEAAGPCRCRDCGTTIERGDPCVDMRDGTGDVLCCACGDEAGMIL